ncbi:uridine kinase [Cellulomonas fengjieae]|uniref:Uridine kinase n=1 Tax=Cellulomonas fengjieae TaxID=2819978 RepID=A0ABS3SMQ4_9CELL|nr:uridine kinase [Cellulomonas fengjieae]MBO3086270.1 uridine kinase [Cellulomonas fengjieae]QVI65686.1 uridine kinase [Cellulomonas fengjieae]
MTDGMGEVVARIVGAVPRGRRALVAIDGVGASGKSALAAALAQRIDARPVVVLHADDFFQPAVVRHARGRLSPEGFWLETYDYATLTSWALTPLRADGDGLYRGSSFDRATGQTWRPAAVQAPHDALVLVEGTFLLRDELVGFWDYSVFVDVPLEVMVRRMALRDGLDPDPEHGLMHRYVGAQRLYFARAVPWQRASLVVDNSAVDGPRIIDAASAAARVWPT